MLLYEATQYGVALLVLSREGRFYVSADMGPNDPWRTMAPGNLEACFTLGPFHTLVGMSFDELCAGGIELGKRVRGASGP